MVINIKGHDPATLDQLQQQARGCARMLPNETCWSRLIELLSGLPASLSAVDLLATHPDGGIMAGWKGDNYAFELDVDNDGDAAVICHPQRVPWAREIGSGTELLAFLSCPFDWGADQISALLTIASRGAWLVKGGPLTSQEVVNLFRAIPHYQQMCDSIGASTLQHPKAQRALALLKGRPPRVPLIEFEDGYWRHAPPLTDRRHPCTKPTGLKSRQ